MKTYKGIDISLWQGAPDFYAVKASNIDFVMIKASQGRCASYNAPFTDPKFTYNINAVLKAGLMVGVYHYLCANSIAQADEEANYFINIMKPYKDKIELWSAVDVEDGGTMGTLEYGALTAIVEHFNEKVKAAGMRPMIYANSDWLKRLWTNKYPIWHASLTDNKPDTDGLKIWQYSFNGEVDGIGGVVDVNIGYDIIGDVNGDGVVNTKDVSALMKYLAKWNVRIDKEQADVNNDGKINNKDVRELLENIAK